MKPLIIYHANCADGFGAAFAAYQQFGDNADYEAMQYGKILPLPDFIHLVAKREVYMLDFSLPREYMDAMFEHSERTVWLDHHKTAFESMLGYVPEGGIWYGGNHLMQHKILLNDNKSGAMLAWEYFMPGTEVPMFIRHIDDYDRWQFKIDGTKEFNKALWSYAPWSFEQWNVMFMHKPYPVAMATLYAEGAAILRATNQNIESAVKSGAMECKIMVPTHGIPPWLFYPGLAANCPTSMHSEAGHALANQSGSYGLCWTLLKNGRVKVGIRSNGDYDVSAIAKAFGGGGHRNAAGFEVPLETLIGWLK